MDGAVLLGDAAAFGPFFVVATNPAESADPSWRPFADLYADPAHLAARIEHVGRTLGSDERVAASIAFQGLAALLVSAPLAAVVAHGELPVLTPTTLHWRPSASGMWPLWCAEPVAVAAPDPAAALAGALVEPHLEPLVAAVRRQVPVSSQVLWGNVASSVAGARRMIAAARPGLVARAAEVAAALLDTGPLRGTGELLPPGPPDASWTFRRRSCCLFYRVPGGGLCGDCVLSARS
ncbi:(2Fe-2S)-binding protein [Actinomycetes bacterium KLBMP 9759]